MNAVNCGLLVVTAASVNVTNLEGLAEKVNTNL